MYLMMKKLYLQGPRVGTIGQMEYNQQMKRMNPRL
jgi:hypothetical protein